MSHSRRAPYAGLCLVLGVLLVSVRAVDARPAPKVDRVIIEGNVLISTARLRGLMETRPTGWLFHRKRFNEATFQEDLDAIRTLYLNSGFLDMRILRKERNFSADGKRVTLRIVLREGSRYMVNQVNLTGNRLLSDAEINEVIQMKADQPFLRLFMAADKLAIRILAARHALLDATVSDTAKVNPADTTVTVVYAINEGEPIRVGNVILQGLEKTKPEVVLRELTLTKGELYDSAKIARTQRQLYQTGIFRSVRVEPILSDSLTNPRDVLAGVTELPGGEFDFGAGYGTRERFRGSAGITQRNWLGRGIRIGANAEASFLNQRLDAGITEPWLLRTHTTGDLRGIFNRRNKRSFVEQQIGPALTVSRELSKTFRAQTAYTIKQVRITAISDSLKQALLKGRDVPDSLRSRRDGSFTQVIIYDTRDDPLNTTRGLFAQVQANLDSPLLGGSIRSFNTLVTMSGSIRQYVAYRKFPAFATSVSFEYVRVIGGKVPLDKQLFLGGDRSVRGFEIYQIGQPVGGQIALSAQNELRAPLGIIQIAGFIDWGGVAPTAGDFSLDDIRVGYGGGIRVPSPIGLIRGDIGFHRFVRYDDPEKDRPLIKRTAFYFGLGQAF